MQKMYSQQQDLVAIAPVVVKKTKKNTSSTASGDTKSTDPCANSQQSIRGSRDEKSHEAVVTGNS